LGEAPGRRGSAKQRGGGKGEIKGDGPFQQPSTEKGAIAKLGGDGVKKKGRKDLNCEEGGGGGRGEKKAWAGPPDQS